MKHETETLRESDRRTPLIRSIARETRDRALAIRQLEASMKDLSAGPGEPITEIRRVEVELFQHRRELESVQKELARLGCSLDADHPQRIVCSADGDKWSYEERLDETGFRPGQPSPKS